MARWAAFSTMTLRFLEEVLGAVTAQMICCTSATLQLFDIVDQKLPEATGEHVLCLLVVLITGVGTKMWPLDIFNFENFFV